MLLRSTLLPAINLVMKKDLKLEFSQQVLKHSKRITRDQDTPLVLQVNFCSD